MAKTYIGLGSNIGNRKGYLQQAVKIFSSHEDIKIIAASNIYESKPQGYTKQRNFYNAVVKIETPLFPLELLKVCRQVEKQLGRERKMRWGPRTIDVDILLYGRQQINLSELTIPHPYLTSRGFVLVPLLEIAPQVVLPSGKRLRTFLTDLPPASYPKRVGSLKT